jgi:hypothetical protein
MAWTKTFTAQQIGTREHMWAAPPVFAGTHEFEQYRAAVDAAMVLIGRNIVGTGGTFTVALSGTGTAGHKNGVTDTVTVTVTNAN